MRCEQSWGNLVERKFDSGCFNENKTQTSFCLSSPIFPYALKSERCVVSALANGWQLYQALLSFPPWVAYDLIYEDLYWGRTGEEARDLKTKT